MITLAKNQKISLLLIGVLTNVVVIAMNLSPFSKVRTLIRTKDASSIYKPVAYGMLLTGILWGAYGALIGDVFVLVANGSSFVSGGLQLILAYIYPGNKQKDAKDFDKKDAKDWTSKEVSKKIDGIQNHIVSIPEEVLPKMYQKNQTMLM